jgi:RNA polymerase sigma-70 factor (ECF subfamily)
MSSGAFDPRFRLFEEGDPSAHAEAKTQAIRVIRSRHYSIPPADQDDLLGEVMRSLIKGIRSPGFAWNGAFDLFVRTVAARRCIDHLRSLRRSLPIDPEASTDQPHTDPMLEASAAHDLLERVLRRLNPGCRRVLCLRFLEALSYREIADLLGRKEGTIRVQVLRCLGEARRILQEDLGLIDMVPLREEAGA